MWISMSNERKIKTEGEKELLEGDMLEGTL